MPDIGGSFTAVGDNWLERLTNSGGAQTGWVYITASGDERETYDLTGRLLTIAHRSGLTLTMTYSTSATPAAIAPSAGLLISVSDNRGRSLSFTYGINGEIARMTDPAGGFTQYAYDTTGRLSRVTWPDGTFRTHHYNEPANTAGANLPFALTVSSDTQSYALTRHPVLRTTGWGMDHWC
jgi:YD repeat-containing protein